MRLRMKVKMNSVFCTIGVSKLLEDHEILTWISDPGSLIQE
jgi:hypothetical protein